MRMIRISVLLLLGCGSASTSTSCPSTSTLTYSNFGQAFMASYCTSCHSGSQPTEGVDLSSASVVLTHLSQVERQAVNSASMPPGGSPTPTSSERAQLGEWLACGAP